MQGRHVMIDLETMDTGPRSAIVSIGAVKFDEERELDHFHIAVSPESSVLAGLTTSKSTEDWWATQPQEIIDAWKSPDAPKLLSALTFFNRWLLIDCGIDAVRPWGNSASFDMVIMEAAYAALNADAPWKFYNQRDYRTMTNMFPGHREKFERSGAHNALEDARYQMRILQSIVQANGLELR